MKLLGQGLRAFVLLRDVASWLSIGGEEFIFPLASNECPFRQSH